MLKLLSQKKIKKNWEEYKSHIETAFVSTEGGHLLTSNSSKDIYKIIYGRLMNPFNHDTHLWTSENENYLLLTQIQECEFTGRKTIILTSGTRTKDVDEETRDQWYQDIYSTISKFGKEHKCVAMYCFSDLDYFIDVAKKTKKWSKVITRYQFYVPL
jgi:hypothetical protein